MSSDVAIRIAGLGKAYRIKHQEQHVTLAEQTLHRLRRPLRKSEIETFWALKDVDLEVRRGEVLGLIGRNGAGKSTLLKVLSRITPPTTGRIDLFGRIGSLLEVGTGFHPELTGRENIYLNGSILGMRKPEINRQFDAIVDFAGVERFLDTPVKRYSSGMYVRLAFAVAAHLETEILLVDEVLAVGDSEFQERCLGKMGELAGAGRTVILVSHNLDSINRLSDRALLIDSGEIREEGPPTSVLASYRETFATSRPSRRSSRAEGTGQCRIVDVTTVDAPFLSDQPKTIRVAVQRREADASRFFLALHVLDSQDRIIAQCDSRLSGGWFHQAEEVQVYDFTLVSPWLLPGNFDLDVFVCNYGIVDAWRRACSFNVLDLLPYESSASAESLHHNTVLPDFSFRVAHGEGLSPALDAHRSASGHAHDAR